MRHIPRIRYAEHAAQAVRVLVLRFVHLGGAEHPAPQLDGVRVAHYMQVDAATGIGHTTKYNI